MRSLRISILSPVVATSIRTIRAANQTAAGAAKETKKSSKAGKGAISCSPHLA